jgi:hypothetical protein
MAVSVSVNHPAYPHQQKIVTLVAQIAASTGALRVSYQVQLVALQVQFVDALMAHGAVPASAILSTMSYGAVDTNAI